jgi:hypothetical protein
MNKAIVLLSFLLLIACQFTEPTVTVEVTYPGQFLLAIQNLDTGSINIIWGEDDLQITLSKSFMNEQLARAHLTATKISLGEFVDHGLLVLVAGDQRDEAPMGDSSAELEVCLK